ncbi:MAG TPA: glycerol-3-phosphate dehydrogenase/oxidase [Pirellulales bacterium]|jgi:glycerol-3-phosphate dehydrogenase|nr:glycerol-3-phosphate dehydrogenase/oxidase [Pirellulales bacterium]
MAQPVLILGAGINGAALARELALNGVGSVIVDIHDIASGATAYSSRLIHGGLRYLEYGEFDLVRESLEERTRWLRLAPQFVRPLRLFIPIRSRRGGLIAGARKFLGMKPRRGGSQRVKHHGLWSVRLGLWLYDVYAHDPTLPRRRLYKSRSPDVVRIDSTKYRWMYAFSDAQIVYPERFTLALLEDARQIAEAAGIPLRIFTYHRVTIDGQTATVHPLDRPDETAFSFQPSAVINATGAWVDRTLSALNVPSKPLMGGTKGSHFITHHEPLRARLAGRAIYVEAADGRPVFVLPFGQATLVGTTDLPFADDPANAVAAPEELQYLVEAVNELFPDLRLSTADIALHYSGVRPLPVSDASATAAVTRRHWLEPNNQSAVPLYSIIGGKLTTCRSLAEDAAGTILARLGLEQRSNSRDRPLPGGESYPRDSVSLAAEWDRIAQRFSLDRRAVETIWSLVGTRSETILADLSRAGSLDSECLPGTSLPRRFVRWIIDHEWATTLDDLVERRLMLLYHPRLSRACLDELAQLLVQSRRMSGPPMAEVEKTIARLAKHFGKSFS